MQIHYHQYTTLSSIHYNYQLMDCILLKQLALHQYKIKYPECKILMKPFLNLKTQPQQIKAQPRKQQWGLINKFKAMEFQKMQQQQKYLDWQKKMSFKKQLDGQINSKANTHSQQLQADRRYYEYIMKKSQEQRTRQQQQKINKYLKRKEMERDNLFKVERMQNSRTIDRDHGYHLDIGEQSERERKQKTEMYQRQMMDTLDIQLRQKSIEVQRTKAYNQEMDQMTLRHQDQLFNRRSAGKKYGQSQSVYKYYQHLDEEKHMRELQLERRFVDEAMLKKQREQREREHIKQIQAQQMKNQVKQTLDQQVKAASLRKYQQSQVNPQDVSYRVINGLFKERPSPYDKAAYIQDLRKQAEQQRLRKQRQKYMSQEEYKINLNQLNKVVNGVYGHASYLDRSLGSIGDSNKYKLELQDQMTDQDHDVSIVRERLESIKNRGRFAYLRKDNKIF